MPCRLSHYLHTPILPNASACLLFLLYNSPAAQYVNAIVNTAGTSKWIKPTSWALLFPEVLRQCDMNDGVKDGVITEPGKCFLDFSKFQCDSNGNAASGSALNSTTCLSGEQVQTFKNVHTNWTDPKTGKLVFSAFNYGSEFGLAAGASGTLVDHSPNRLRSDQLNSRPSICCE